MSEHIENTEKKDQSKESMNVPSWTWKALVIFCLILFVLLWIINNEREKKPNNNSSNYPPKEQTVQQKPVEFPTSGEGYATSDKPLKASLSPARSYFRIIGPGNARLVLNSNPSIYFICNKKAENPEQAKQWSNMPSDEYLIYSDGVEMIRVSWWQ